MKVNFDRAFPDPKFSGNRFICQALRNEANDLDFASGQRLAVEVMELPVIALIKHDRPL